MLNYQRVSPMKLGGHPYAKVFFNFPGTYPMSTMGTRILIAMFSLLMAWWEMSALIGAQVQTTSAPLASFRLISQGSPVSSMREFKWPAVRMFPDILTASADLEAASPGGGFCFPRSARGKKHWPSPIPGCRYLTASEACFGVWCLIFWCVFFVWKTWHGHE